MKVVLIGPTYPFRGGISHYTTLLCQALREHHEVKFVSFIRQYPAFLFPGKTDKDPSAERIRIDPVDYLIDSLNPLTWFKAAREIILYVRPKNISNLRGQNNDNLKLLKKYFGLDRLDVMPDEDIVGDGIRLEAGE